MALMAASTFCNGRTSDRYIYRGGLHVIAVLMFKGASMPRSGEVARKRYNRRGRVGTSILALAVT
jgi:hypothetical protein